MDGVFIIGLPIQLRSKLEAVAKQEEIYVIVVSVGIGKKGTLQLLPDPSDAVHMLRAYYEPFGNSYEDALVLVLPYAAIPTDVEDELGALEDLGAEVVYASQGTDGWPILAKKVRPDTRFLNEVFKRTIAELLGEEDESPSDYFRSASEKNPNIIIVKGALDSCDQVAEHRRKFMREVADALVEIVDKKGKVGRLDVFFRSLGLEHAQTGGISTTLKVSKGGKRVHEKTTSTHLKQGDKTTPQAAVRVYYQEFFIEQQCYVAILYAGPHPDDDITSEHELPH